jgi:uncharacterized membrane protein HdeD (DUF308 family)
MIRLLIQNWWLLFLRGVLAIAFAIFIFVFLPFLPAPFLRQFAFAGLTVIFALFACVTGVLTMVAAVRGAESGDSSWPMLVEGIGVTIGGLVILLFPGLTLIHLVRLIAVTALVVGILEVVAGVHLRRHVADEWLLISGGIISLAFGAALFLSRVSSIAAALTWISLFAFANGLAMIGFALRLRNLRQSIHALAGSPEAAKVKSRGRTGMNELI